MKKILMMAVIMVVMSGFASFADIDPITTSIDIQGKDNDPTIWDRKSMSITAMVSNLSPYDNGISIDNGPSTGSWAEISFKTWDSVDQTIRIGTMARRLVTSGPIDATYDIIKVGWAGRMYVLDWGEFSDVHGIFNMYALLGIDAYSASRKTLVSGTPPVNMTGGGVTFGGGIQMIFSPITSFMLEATYQRTWIEKDSVELPLEGFVISAGLKVDLI